MKTIEPQPSNGSGNGHATAARTAVAVNAKRVNPENLAFVEDLYYRWRTDSASVNPAWRSYFESLDTAGEPAIAPPETFKRSIFAGGTVVPLRSKAAASVASERVHRLVEAYPSTGTSRRNLGSAGLGQARRARSWRSRTTAFPTPISRRCSAPRTSPGPIAPR